MAPRIVLLAALLAFGFSGPGVLADDRLRGEVASGQDINQQAARVDLKAGGAGDGKGPAQGVSCCTRCPNHAWCSPQTWQCYNAKVKTYYLPCR
mmetsp:Transcript_135309/g.432048  ORF Transcript_135309/g.432048 Transcript_135309/m.432048 type:complete len:94 (-) Transcript_135309:48-329(-)